MGTMVLYLGEKDGYELRISAAECPHLYYAVPNQDEEKIRNTHGNNAKRELRDRLGRLAYEFDDKASTSERFVMCRKPELDKIQSTGDL